MPRRSLARLAASCLVALIAAGCGSGNGAKKPDGDDPVCPTPEACPVCPAAPKPGPAPVVIGADQLDVDRSRRISLMALSADGKGALVRVEDELVGDFFQHLDLTSGTSPKAIKAWPFQAFTEPTTRKQALKAVRPEAPWPPSQRSAAGLVALAADEADAVAIYVMKGERAVKVARIARLKDDAGALADVAITKLAWDPTGSRIVVIHEQTLAASPGFTSDWVHVVTVDPQTLPF
ncbi:MAG: hypothetical protein IT385_12490 [Deltaproteobacteria bacterium]|nr:hypothetical protein [Deltaproteobacteria bacterium]